MRTDRIMILVAALAALVVAATAAAAKQSSSLTLVVLGSSPTAVAAAPAPTQGGLVTFNVSTTQTDHPSVNVRCYQAGSWVYDGWQSFWQGAPEPVFTLSSNYWTSGAADCTARLVYYDRQGRLQTLATTGFHVNA
jgi:hypothetical protein